MFSIAFMTCCSGTYVPALGFGFRCTGLDRLYIAIVLCFVAALAAVTLHPALAVINPTCLNFV